MKVLVTGPLGQLGRALQSTAPAGCMLEAIDIADLDLPDSAAISARVEATRPDLVINAAAYTAVDMAESEEQLARSINAGAVAAITQALARTGGKLVHVSTDFVFDGTSSRSYQPQDQRNPLSVYGRTKAEGEDALRSSDILLRTTWFYTAGGANFVRTMLRLMRERETISVVADQIGSPTWAPGPAQTIWGLVCSRGRRHLPSQRCRRDQLV